MQTWHYETDDLHLFFILPECHKWFPLILPTPLAGEKCVSGWSYVFTLVRQRRISCHDKSTLWVEDLCDIRINDTIHPFIEYQLTPLWSRRSPPDSNTHMSCIWTVNVESLMLFYCKQNSISWLRTRCALLCSALQISSKSNRAENVF